MDVNASGVLEASTSSDSAPQLATIDLGARREPKIFLTGIQPQAAHEVPVMLTKSLLPM